MEMTRLRSGPPTTTAAALARRCAAPRTLDESGFQVRSRATRYIAEHGSGTLTAWQSQYFQLGRGHFIGTMYEASLGSLYVGCESYNVATEQRCSAPRDSLLYFRGGSVDGTLVGRSWVQGTPLDPDMGVLCLDTCDMQVITPTNYGGVCSVIPLEMLACVAGDLDLRALFPRSAWIALDAGELRDLDSLIEQILVGSTDSPTEATRGHASRRQHDVITAAANVLRHASTGDRRAPRPDTRAYIFNKARELIHESPEDPPSVGEICARLRVSERTLEYVFLERTQLSPKAYVLSFRLNRVCQDLLSGKQASICSLAMNCGFSHYGRF